MSWLLIFISGFVPILMLGAMVLAESMGHAGMNLRMVKVPVNGVAKVRIIER